MISRPDADSDHRQKIVDQFTRQAGAFAAMPAHSNEQAFELLFHMAAFSNQDTVLDVGCGPGLVACAVAPKVAQVTGIDLTPAMLDKARQLQQQRDLSNLRWQTGDIQALPFKNASFSCALTRYTFHHLMNPQAVFDEMCRVTRPKGRIIVIDVVPEPAKREAYDQVEKLRDPSHTRALTFEELVPLGSKAGLGLPETRLYGLEVNLEDLLAASFPDADCREELRRRFEADLSNNYLGFDAHRDRQSICIRFPTAIAVWRKL
ncbi:MAG TPA: class I SAM-dependent methyltransferase [Clostridia bacterium]|nr:class I SAM-dependent methyltransferase [Clostridia bacterium]